MRETPIRLAVAGLAGALALVALPGAAGAARRPDPKPEKSSGAAPCSQLTPKPGEYFLYYPTKRCKNDQKQTKSESTCANDRYTLFYGDRSDVCNTFTKAKGSFVVRMDADQIVGRPGPAGATGLATMAIDTDRGSVCYHLSHSKMAGPTQAHIHKGAKGKNGPVVIDLFAGRYEYNCVRADHDLLKSIVKDPAGYFIKLHTADFPNGAVRGQLGKVGGFRYS